METIRDILARHHSGISRPGLLAWARLRIDPALTDEQLEAELVRLGDEVEDVDGFLYLRANREAGPSSAGSEPWAGAERPGTPEPWAGWESATGPEPSAGWGAPEGHEPAGSAQGGWRPADAAPPWLVPGSSTPGPGTGEAPGSRWGAEGEAGEEGEASPAGTGWPPRAASGRGRGCGAVVGVALVVWWLAGLVGGMLQGGAGATPVPTGPVETPSIGEVISWSELEVGDCIIAPTEEVFQELRRVPCDTPHDGEVFALQDHPEGGFPGSDALATFAEETCTAAFGPWTGTPYGDQDLLTVGWLIPTEESWAAGDRLVQCYLRLADGSRAEQSYRDADP